MENNNQIAKILAERDKAYTPGELIKLCDCDLNVNDGIIGWPIDAVVYHDNHHYVELEKGKPVLLIQRDTCAAYSTFWVCLYGDKLYSISSENFEKI